MQIGQILRSRYKIIKILGSGGFGDTYLAEDIDLPNHPKCVVKHLKTNSHPGVLDIATRLFDSEAQVLYRLGKESDLIPKLFAHFEEEGEFYLVQEFVDGEDLSSEIYPGKQWGETEVINLLGQILEVFQIIHAKSIIHRDIKPANLMRRRQDGKIIAIDFGAVKEIGTLMVNPQGQTINSVAIGTNGYMPSEQANGQPKLCSDIHAIGMLGIFALTGIPPRELPKDPKSGEVIWQNWSKVSDKTADVLNKMVRYHFMERYQSAFDAMDAIANLKPKPIREVIPQSKLRPNAKQRREILKTLGWLSAGVGLSMLWDKLLNPGSQSPEPKSTFSGQSKISPDLSVKPALQSFDVETITVDRRGSITERQKFQAIYFTEYLGNGVGLEMVEIPAGGFLMGSPDGEKLRKKYESPQRQVTISKFFLSKYVVTQAQYAALMGKNPAKFKGDNLPVEQVSWNDAVVFCRKLSQRTGRNYRLPSEAEWEYACRAGTTTPFYFGETITTDLANYNGNSAYPNAPKGENRQKTTPVGTFPPNQFGLHDTHGNVWEWCQDTRHDSYDGAPNDGSAWIDNNNQFRILRGGSWNHSPDFCRSAFRGVYFPGVGNNDIGFRVACSSL